MVRFCVLGTLERSFQASTRSTLYVPHKGTSNTTPVVCAHKAHPKQPVASMQMDTRKCSAKSCLLGNGKCVRLWLWAAHVCICKGNEGKPLHDESTDLWTRKTVNTQPANFFDSRMVIDPLPLAQRCTLNRAWNFSWIIIWLRANLDWVCSEANL